MKTVPRVMTLLLEHPLCSGCISNGHAMMDEQKCHTRRQSNENIETE